MAGGFHFIWIPVLFTCVVCTSDNRNVIAVLESLGISNENPDVAKILSKIAIPNGIDPSHKNLTSVIIKICEGMKEALAKSQRQLQQMAHRYNQLAEESFGLRSEARRLKVKLAMCISTATPIAGTYQTHLQIKMNQMLEKLDPDTLLIFKIMTLTREVSTLQKKLKLAANSNKTATEIREVQRQLEEKMTEQKAKIAEANERFSSGTLILQIISLQNQIWDLQEAKSRGEKNGSQTSVDEIQVKHQLTRKITQLQDKGDTNFASLLELIFVRSRIAELKRMISDLIEKSKIFAADARRQLTQKSGLLMKKILQLKEDKNNKTLTKEIMILQTEVLHFEQLINNPQNITNPQIQELRAILDQEKQRQDIIQRQLEATEYAKAQLIIQIISVMEELKEQHLTGQPTTVIEAKEQEYAKALAKITELQRKLRLLTEMGSKFVERYEQMKIDFDQNIAELNRTEDIQAALILKLIKLHDELKALKEQIVLSEDRDLTFELQRQLEKRQEELNSTIAHIESLTSSPGTILKIIELQYDLWNLRNKAANGTRSNHEEELQDRLDGFINEINRAGENTKLILKIMTLQSQLEHLKPLLEKTYNSTSPNMLLINEDLIEELTFKRTELQKYIRELNAKNPSNAKLILATTDLYKILKRIEKENHDDNATSSLTLSLLQIFLQNKNREYASIKDKVTELERELRLKTEECSGLEEHRDQLKTELEKKIAELNKTKDAETALILNVINLHAERRALREKILKAEDPEIISGLHRELEEMQDDLNTKIAEIKRLIANPRTILKIIELQDEIWDLQNKDTNGTAGNQIRELQNRMDRFISQIGSRDQENTKLMLKIINLQSQVKHLQKLLSNREMPQTSKLSELTSELAAKKAELEKQVNDLKEKDQENAKLILDIIDLQTQLENLEKTAAATISNLRNQLKNKEEEHSRDQAEIQGLRLKLKETEDNCSDHEQTIKTLQQNLTNTITEMQSKSDSVTSLALKISALTQELEQLKTQVSNSVSRSKVDELKKNINEKNKELEELRKELKNRSAQPQRLLQIINLQTEIEKLSTVAQNDTDFDKIGGLQEKLNYLIRGIQDEENENTKLTFQILNQRDEIARLRKQQEQKNQTQAAKIKDLEDKLDFIKKLIKETSAALDTKGAQILELETKKELLEGELSALKENHIQSLAELQKRLNLKERQLEDAESQLQHADSENFKYVMEIADMRAKLKEAETQTSKTSDKKIIELEKQLKTQERETKKLEAANKDLTQEVTELRRCCTQVPDNCEDLQTDLQQCREDANRLQQQLHQKNARLNQMERNLQRQIEENNQLQDDFNILRAERNRLEKYVEDLEMKLVETEEKTIHTSNMTFDPNTAHPRILLSADKTEMSTAKFLQRLPDNPERFDVILGVLGETGFSSGRHYWEVSVGRKTCYHLGMTSESSQRKGSPRFKPRNGYWTIVLDKQGQLKAIEDRGSAIIRLQMQPVTLGIMLDYSKGTISFYDSGTRSHLYSFVGQDFTDRIYPFVNFCVEDGEAPNPIVLTNPGPTAWIQ